jgi:hypothetical protein
MPTRSQWSYVQARLQARHGARLGEEGWRALEGAKSAEHFLARTRTTPLARFVARIDAQMSSHTMERILRTEWRDCVAELAGWVPAEWRPAVRWTRHLAELPIVDGVGGAPAPEWLGDDSELAAFSETVADNGGSVAARWFAHWRRLWPSRAKRERRALDRLCAIVMRHVDDLRRANVHDTSARHRQSLARGLVRLFRRHPASPTALFCHLALVALDLERLRGALIRRRLFQTDDMRRAA